MPDSGRAITVPKEQPPSTKAANWLRSTGGAHAPNIAYKDGNMDPCYEEWIKTLKAQ